MSVAPHLGYGYTHPVKISVNCRGKRKAEKHDIVIHEGRVTTSAHGSSRTMKAFAAFDATLPRCAALVEEIRPIVDEFEKAWHTWTGINWPTTPDDPPYLYSDLAGMSYDEAVRRATNLRYEADMQDHMIDKIMQTEQYKDEEYLDIDDFEDEDAFDDARPAHQAASELRTSADINRDRAGGWDEAAEYIDRVERDAMAVQMMARNVVAGILRVLSEHRRPLWESDEAGQKLLEERNRALDAEAICDRHRVSSWDKFFLAVQRFMDREIP